MQTSSEFQLELDPGEFPNIPKEFNMRPHTDGVHDAYSFSHQGSGSIGALDVISRCDFCKYEPASASAISQQMSSMTRLHGCAGVEGRVDQRFDVEMLRAAQGGVSLSRA